MLAEAGFAGDGEWRERGTSGRYSPRLKPGVDMICIASDCANLGVQNP